MTDDTKHITPSSDLLHTPHRRQKKRSFAESGLGAPASEIKTNSASKKLVYMQDINTGGTQVKELDLYEFDSDSEEVKHTRKKLVRRNNNRVKKTPSRSARPKNITRSAKKIVTVMEEAKSTEKNIGNYEIPAVQNDESNIVFGFDGTKEDCDLSKVTVVKLKPNEELNLSVVTASVVQKGCPLTPWRFTDCIVSRNPHLIQLKNSSLPRLDQEMVLNHSVVDNFENSTRVNTNIPSARKSDRKKQTQKNITDYFDCNSVVHHEDIAVSLFEDSCCPCEDNLDKDETDRGLMASTTGHHYFDSDEDRDDKLKLSVSIRDKKYSHQPKVKKVGDSGGEGRVKTIGLMEDETYLLQTPKIKRGGSKSNQSHRKRKAGKIGKEEEEITEQLLANLSLEYEKIENFPLLIDD